jgi:hypothetical protein
VRNERIQLYLGEGSQSEFDPETLPLQCFKHICGNYTTCYHVGFEVLTAVVIKSSIFSDIMPYSPMK